VREIKFRLFWEDTKNMEYANLEELFCGDWGLRQHVFFEAKVMQFTGLKDKNGKEIYEGDIIYNHVEDCYVEVTWAEDYARFDFGLGCGDYSRDDISKFEVVGNKFENPELLNK